MIFISCDALSQNGSKCFGFPDVHDRFVRQDTALWDELHAGRLTSGKLNAALGFYEPQAARQLRMTPAFASHSRLLEVRL